MKVCISIICLLTIAFCATPDFNNQGTWEGTCNINPTRQSPIDIPCFDHINKCPSLPTYKTYWNDPTSSFGASTKYDLTTTMKDGHWVQFTNGSGSYIFKSAQFHLHAPSEHTINGQSYPL
jgi:carbonic anhydrase